MATRFRRGARAVDIWPGFVDALATLLLVLIFLLVVFVVAEFFLGRVLSGREDELAGLKNAIAELEGLLSLEKGQTSDLRSDLEAVTAQLTAANRDREDLRAERLELLREAEALALRGDELAEALRARADGDEDAEALRLLLAETRAALAAARAEQYDAVVEAAESQSELDEERRLSDAARERLALLNSQLARLRTQLAAVQRALDVSEREASDKDTQIADLGRRLNVALAHRVEELQQARSVFFGRLREVLGGRSDVRIDGDRFVILRRPVRVGVRQPGRRGAAAGRPSCRAAAGDFLRTPRRRRLGAAHRRPYRPPADPRGSQFRVQLGAVGGARYYRGAHARRQRRPARTAGGGGLRRIPADRRRRHRGSLSPQPADRTETHAALRREAPEPQERRG